MHGAPITLLRRSLMTKRLLASSVCLAIATSLLAASGFAQAPAAPATTAPATPAPAASAPATPAASAATPATGAKTHAMGRMQRIERLQTALNANGCNLTVDGKMGPKTHAGLMEFQKAHGLKVTGRPDKETRDALKMTG